MNALIEHTVTAVDPRTVHDYVDSLKGWELKAKASGFNITTLGQNLYPRVIEALKPLRIVSIFNFTNAYEYESARVPNITTYEQLAASVEEIASFWPRFEAIIAPEVETGTERVHVEIYSTFAHYLHRTGAPHCLGVWADFRTPQKARTGLRNLAKLLDGAFTETLHALPMPNYIALLYQAAWEELNELRRFDKGLDADPLYAYEEGRLEELQRMAALQHLKFLKPHLERLGITPVEISHSGGLRDSVSNYDEIISIVADPSYDDLNPDVLAIWNGRELKLETNYQENGARFGLNKGFAVRVKNRSKPGTLEDLMEAVLGLGNSKK